MAKQSSTAYRERGSSRSNITMSLSKEGLAAIDKVAKRRGIFRSRAVEELAAEENERVAALKKLAKP